jgi:glutamyl-tRNA synthetase
MNSDGTKLSKRQGDIQIKSYKEDGIFPNALLNFITKAGGGFTSNSLDELYPMEKLIKNVIFNSF